MIQLSEFPANFESNLDQQAKDSKVITKSQRYACLRKLLTSGVEKLEDHFLREMKTDYSS